MLETIYDISDIPYFPRVPGTIEWCLLALALILSALFLIRFRRKKIESRDKLLNAALVELNALLSNKDPSPEVLDRTRLRILRVLELRDSVRYTALGSKDLRRISSISPSPLSAILNALADLEDLRYAKERELSGLISKLEQSARTLGELIKGGANA